MTFAEVEAERARRGIQQKELCRKAGVDPNTYSSWKVGRQKPNTGTLEKVVDALARLVAEGQEAAAE